MRLLGNNYALINKVRLLTSFEPEGKYIAITYNLVHIHFIITETGGALQCPGSVTHGTVWLLSLCKKKTINYTKVAGQIQQHTELLLFLDWQTFSSQKLILGIIIL